MHRLLFQYRDVKLWSYPTFLYLGMVAGVIAGNLASHITGADSFRVFVATMILIPPALAGARLFYVAGKWERYRNCPSRIWSRQDGGVAMYGGVPVMLVLSVPVLAGIGLRFGEFWDVASLTILTGMVFAKIGCLLNGCCAGRPSQSAIAIALPNSRGVRAKRIPVQFLESVWAALLLGVASMLLGRMPFAGALFLIVAALYGAGRLALEFLREHEPASGVLASGHLISVLTMVSAIGILIVHWPR
jgi:phosphatidylglycerol:prolipoprotein diacylglycerol transferase